MEVDTANSHAHFIHMAHSVLNFYEGRYSDAEVLLEVLCKAAVQMIEQFQDPVFGWDFNQPRSDIVTKLVNIFFPHHGFNIPWRVSFENVCTYRKLILFGLRPFIATGSDENLVRQLTTNYDRWLKGCWTPVRSVYCEDGIRIELVPSKDEIDVILSQVRKLAITT